MSSDRDDESMKDYLKEMPWLAIPHGDNRKKTLSRLFDVSGMYVCMYVCYGHCLVVDNHVGALSDVHVSVM